MNVTVTWDAHERRQADIEVPDEATPEDITALADHCAHNPPPGTETISTAEIGSVDWVEDANGTGRPTRFGGRFR